MNTTLKIIVLVAAAIAIALFADAWHSARRDSNQLAATVASQNNSIQQAQDREKQRDAQLATALATITAQKNAVKIPVQAAKGIPSVLPQLPLPVSIQIPVLNTPLKPGEPPPPAIMTIPQSDLKPLYDDLQDCRASAIEIDAAKKDLADEQARTAALAQERDAAIAAAHGGTFWTRVKRNAKWFAIGIAAGAAVAAAARH